jgi:predicted nuclease of predicted toxin-antitoxin system
VNIVADENVDKEIVDRLRVHGYNVVSIAEDDPGIDDQTVLDRSLRVDGVLLTADKDFGDLVFVSACCTPASGSYALLVSDRTWRRG